MRGLFNASGSHRDIRYDGSRSAFNGNAREFGCDFSLCIFEEVFDAATADVGAEELGCEIGDLVCFVEDYGIGRAEDVTEAVLLQSQIRQQQVVIYDDDVRVERITASESHMTA